MNNKPLHEWKQECMKWYGVVLTGQDSHWCPDWDGLPIDETSPEYSGCNCIKDSDQI